MSKSGFFPHSCFLLLLGLRRTCALRLVDPSARPPLSAGIYNSKKAGPTAEGRSLLSARTYNSEKVGPTASDYNTWCESPEVGGKLFNEHYCCRGGCTECRGSQGKAECRRKSGHNVNDCAKAGGGCRIDGGILKKITDAPCATYPRPPCLQDSTIIDGDPHVTNVKGEKFNILALGVMSLLHLTKASGNDILFNMDGTITRVGSLCQQTFISDLHFTGKLMQKEASIRAQEKSMQLCEGNLCSNTLQFSNTSQILAAPDAISFLFDDFSLLITQDSHWGWPFLNLKAFGLEEIAGVRLGGLLGGDNWTEAATAPSGCVELLAIKSTPFLSTITSEEEKKEEKEH